MGKSLDRFEAGFDRLMVFFAALVAGSIGLFAILIPVDLFLRSVGWGNMWWLYEGIEYVLYAGIFLGAPWVLKEGAHVRVDVLVATLPKRISARLEQALDLVGAAICASLTYYAVRSMIADYLEDSLPDKVLVIPDWILMLVFSVAFTMLTIEFLLRLRRVHGEPDAKTLGSSGPPEEGF
ncbi:MAG: TRAP transporter small permease [Alphaproteobacteria bacterium]